MNVTKLREEFSALKGETDAFIALPEDHATTQEELDANAKRIERMDFISKQVEQHAKFAQMKLADPADTNAPGSVTLPSEPSGRQEFSASIVAAELPEQAKQRYEIHKAAINRFIRDGVHTSMKFGTNGAITTGSGSNALLPVTVGQPVAVKSLKNPLRQVLAARGLNAIVTDTSEPISIPTFDDTANVADIIPQNQTGDNEKEPTVAGLTLGNTLYDSGTVWSSNTLLNSLSFDLIGFLQPRLDERIDRAQATAWVNSIKTTGTVGKTTASTTLITYLELLAWQHSVPVAYRPNGAFMLSDGLFQALRGMMDSQNHPIYQESLRDDAPDKLLGWPVFISSDLAAPGPGAVAGVAIAADQMFIRDISQRRIARYLNDADRRDQFGIAEFANGGFAFLPNGVRLLKFAAS